MFDPGLSLQMRLLRCQQEPVDGLPTVAWSRRERTMVLLCKVDIPAAALFVEAYYLVLLMYYLNSTGTFVNSCLCTI